MIGVNPVALVELHVEAQIDGSYAFEYVTAGGHACTRRLKHINPDILRQAATEADVQLKQFYASQATGA